MNKIKVAILAAGLAVLPACLLGGSHIAVSAENQKEEIAALNVGSPRKVGDKNNISVDGVYTPSDSKSLGFDFKVKIKGDKARLTISHPKEGERDGYLELSDCSEGTWTYDGIVEKKSTEEKFVANVFLTPSRNQMVIFSLKEGESITDDGMIDCWTTVNKSALIIPII